MSRRRFKPDEWSRELHVKVMADIAADGVWDAEDVGGCCDSLPITNALVARIRAWQDWHDRLDDEYWALGVPEVLYWECHPGAPLEAFNAEGEAIAQALREELPAEWTVSHSPLASSYGSSQESGSRAGKSRAAAGPSRE